MLVIASSLPDKPENITFLRTLTIVEPDNKLLVLGSVAGVLTTLVLLAALYARSFESSPLGPIAAPRPLRSFVCYKHGATKAKGIVVALMKGEVKTAWGLVTEAFDFAGDAAVFMAIKDDAQNPIFKARVATIIVPVCTHHRLACTGCPLAHICSGDTCFRRGRSVALRQVWVAFCLSAVVSAVSLLVRGAITIDQLRQRRRDIAEFDAPRPYLHRLKAKIRDGERTLNMVRPLAHAHVGTRSHGPARAHAHTDTRARTHTRTRARAHRHNCKQRADRTDCCRSTDTSYALTFMTALANPLCVSTG